MHTISEKSRLCLRSGNTNYFSTKLHDLYGNIILLEVKITSNQHFQISTRELPAGILFEHCIESANETI